MNEGIIQTEARRYFASALAAYTRCGAEVLQELPDWVRQYYPEQTAFRPDGPVEIPHLDRRTVAEEEYSSAMAAVMLGNENTLRELEPWVGRELGLTAEELESKTREILPHVFRWKPPDG